MMMSIFPRIPKIIFLAKDTKNEKHEILSYCFLSGRTWVHEPSVYVDICTVQAMVQGRGSAEKTAGTVEVERGRKSRGAPAPDVHKGFTKLGSDLVVFMSISTIKSLFFLLKSFSHL